MHVSAKLNFGKNCIRQTLLLTVWMCVSDVCLCVFVQFCLCTCPSSVQWAMWSSSNSVWVCALLAEGVNFCSVIVLRLYIFDLCIFAILLPYKLRRPTIVFLYLSNFVFVLAKNGKHHVCDGALAWRGRRQCKLEENWWQGIGKETRPFRYSSRRISLLFSNLKA